MKEEHFNLGIDCPKGHVVSASFTHANMRELLENGKLMFYCVTHDLKIPPTPEAIKNLRRDVGLD